MQELSKYPNVKSKNKINRIQEEVEMEEIYDEFKTTILY